MSALTVRDFAIQFPLVAELEASARPHRPSTAQAVDAAPRGWCDICHRAVEGAFNGLCRYHCAMVARSRLRIRRERRAAGPNLRAWGHVGLLLLLKLCAAVVSAAMFVGMAAPIAVGWLNGDGQ